MQMGARIPLRQCCGPACCSVTEEIGQRRVALRDPPTPDLAWWARAGVTVAAVVTPATRSPPHKCLSADVGGNFLIIPPPSPQRKRFSFRLE